MAVPPSAVPGYTKYGGILTDPSYTFLWRPNERQAFSLFSIFYVCICFFFLPDDVTDVHAPVHTCVGDEN